MTRLKIRNFGPIKAGFPHADGFFDIAKLTIFVGNQGSGKSTIAKLISTFLWIEKALVRGDYTADWFIENGNFRDTFLAYHRIENYLCKDSELRYSGNAYSIHYVNGKIGIEKNENSTYELPQIMYVPAERSFISNVEDPRKYKELSAPLVEFLGEYTKALKKLSAPKRLPVNNALVEYDKAKETVYINGDDYRIKLLESSSGFQSAVPLFLVSSHLCDTVKNSKNSAGMSSAEKNRFSKMTANILEDTSLTDEQKHIAISEIGKKFNKSTFINIIEEPEQNLFPISQWNIFQELVAINNTENENKLIITTHSPYLVNYLTLAIKAYTLKAQNDIPEMIDGLEHIGFYPQSLVKPDTAAIYELNEMKGAITLLDMPNDLPSDENYLNVKLGETNEIFAKLLEIQERLCA